MQPLYKWMIKCISLLFCLGLFVRSITHITVSPTLLVSSACIGILGSVFLINHTVISWKNYKYFMD